MKMIAKLALSAPALLALAACGGAEEAETTDEMATMPVEEPMADPAMDPMATDDAMMPEDDAMMSEDDAMTDEEMTSDPAMTEEPEAGM